MKQRETEHTPIPPGRTLLVLPVSGTSGIGWQSCLFSFCPGCQLMEPFPSVDYIKTVCIESVVCRLYCVRSHKFTHRTTVNSTVRKQHQQRLSIILLGIHTGSTVIHRVGGEIALSIALTSGPQHLIPCIRPYFHHATFSLQTGLSLTDPTESLAGEKR